MRFKVDVDGKNVARKIERRITAGIDDATGDIARGIETRAKARIRRKGAIWRYHLLEGFEDATVKFGDRTIVSVTNVSEHAPAQEYGVSGVNRSRDTPLSYKKKKPPVQALIPWVRAHLGGMNFDPRDGGGSDGGDGGSGGDSGGGGSRPTDPPEEEDPQEGFPNPGDYGYNPLMGADDLSEGTTVSGFGAGNRYFSGEITYVCSDTADVDYRIRNDDEDYTLDIKIEWISDFDGKGASASEVEVGQTVYIGNSNSWGLITELSVDPDEGVVGAYIDFDGDWDWDDLLDLSEFEIVTEVDPFGVKDGHIEIDGNGLYVPGTNFDAHDMNDEWDIRDTYPGQRLVIYDMSSGDYRRAHLVGYPDRTDEKIEVEFDDDGRNTWVSVLNTDNFRLVGSEFWDSLTEDDQKGLMKDHFDNTVRDGHKNLSSWKAPGSGLTDPTNNRLDWVRDVWLSDVWDNYRDKWYVKEHFRNMVAQFGSTKARASSGALGGVSGLNNSDRFVSVFLSKGQLSNSSKSEDEYRSTVRHESIHALSNTMSVDYPGKQIDWYDMLDHADWQRDGSQTSRATSDLPLDAKNQMFHDETINSGEPIGGTDWIGDAYDAAMNGENGIKTYSPTLKSQDPVLRIHEAANHAYWLQSVAAREEKKFSGFIDDEDKLFVNWSYATKNAAETLATFHQVMTEDLDLLWAEERLEYLDELYPWLIEEWLKFFNPSEEVEEILKRLGYDVNP
jgi:hypothetical protein